MTSTPNQIPDHVDVLIVGAGISGIDAACRVQSRCPDRSFLVLEAREALGGTWDMFRYPGVRSDSDIFTLSFPFRPWTGTDSMVDGPEILNYIRRTVAHFGVDRHIRTGVKVVAADWCPTTSRWTVTVKRSGAGRATSRETLTCGFLYACTGYYDYAAGHSPDFPGADDFTGTVVHPQAWPEDLDYAGKRVVVIGSGATAVTLVPALSRDAAQVTMLQRTPSWISARPRHDPFADRIRRRLPPGLAHWVIRTRNAARSNHLYWYCRRYPERARAAFLAGTTRAVGADMTRDHFTPPYAPWDQRVCVAADGDLFTAIRDGTAEIVTDHIERFVPDGIRLTSGTTLPADVVVTATGLQMLSLGRIALSVDGEPVDPARRMLWRGTMLNGVPNFALCIGYVSLSWTMRADLTARLVCRILNYMRRRNLSAVTVDPPKRGVAEKPLMDLASGYIQRSIRSFPRLGDRSPWMMRQVYLLDAAGVAFTRLGRHLRGAPRKVPATPRTPVRSDAA
ncbi:MAG: NAD(P)/FAD-dependent oxidoreductase [Pseudonocardia sp.]|nr:NAD(P)/FAD-dependent oxidoreductase [Pseudonocardia sp.]